MTLVDPAIEGVDGNAPNKMSTQLLTRTLIHAFYWMDDGLQHYMQDQVGFSLPRAQSMMMICIGDGICRQSDVAKYLRITKQAVRQSVKELEAKGLVVIDPDPQDGRQKVLRFTDKTAEAFNLPDPATFRMNIRFLTMTLVTMASAACSKTRLNR